MSVVPGTIKAIYSRPHDNNLRPVLQILSISTLIGQPDRYKIVLSDGENYTTSLLSSQVVARLGGCPFKQHQVVCLEEYMINSIQDKVFIMIHQIREVAPPLPTGQIGNPQVYRPTNPGSFAPAVSTAAVSAPQYANPAPPAAAPRQQMPAQPAMQYQAPAPSYANPYSSLPSHSPFAAGMAQSMPPAAPAMQNPYDSRSAPSAGPVRYLKSTESAIPMNQLTIYTQKWTIKARVSTKSDLRTYRNARGEGQLMNIELVDQYQGEMRATFFGSAALKFHPMLQVGQVYTFSKGSVKPANPRFNPKAQYELMFDEHSEILPVADDQSIPAMRVSLVPIASLGSQAAVGDTVDVAGIVISAGDVTSVTIKASGRDTAKRSLVIGDDSGASIDLTIWGEKAEKLIPDQVRGCVLMAKGCRLGDYNGRSLSTSASSLIEIDPMNHARTNELRAWWQQQGMHMQLNPLSSNAMGAQAGGQTFTGRGRTTIQAMRQEDVNNLVVSNGVMGMDAGKRAVNQHTVKATVMHIPVREGGSSLYYKSCATEVDDGRGGRRLCQKKTDLQGDMYVCAEQHMNRAANARFILSMRVQDASGECLVRAFHDEAKTILGMDASEIDQAPDPSLAQQLAVDKALFRTFILKIRSKKEIHMDEERLNMIVAQASLVTPHAEATHMLSSIRSYLLRIGA